MPVPCPRLRSVPIAALLLLLIGPAAWAGQGPKGAASSRPSVADAARTGTSLRADLPGAARGEVYGDLCSNAPYIGSLLQSGPIPQSGTTEFGVSDAYDLGTDGSCAGGGTQYEETGFGQDAVFRIRVDETCDLNVDMDPTDTAGGETDDLALYVVTDCAAVAATCLGVDDAGGGGEAEDVAFTAVAGTTYYVIVDGYNFNSGPFELSVTETTSTGCNLMPTFFEAEDQSAFESVAPGLPTEDFEEANVPAGGSTDCGPFIGSATNSACFEAGEILEGLSFLLTGGIQESDVLQAVGSDHPDFVNSSAGIAASVPWASIEIALPAPGSTAVAFDFGSNGIAITEGWVEVFGTNDVPLAYASVRADNGQVRGGSERFVGVLSPEPIGRLVVNTTVNREFVDDVRFGEPAVYFEDFAAGLGTTTASSICGGSGWFQETTCPASAGAPSPLGHAIWQAFAGACDQESPTFGDGQSSQRLRTDPIDISACATGAVLEFGYLIDFPESFAYDRARVEIGVDGAFRQVATNPLNPGDGLLPSCTGVDQPIGNLVWDGSWHTLQIPVGRGDELLVDFYGETVDEEANNGQGFLVDNVRVFCSDRVFEDGFETGNTLVWSSSSP